MYHPVSDDWLAQSWQTGGSLKGYQYKPCTYVPANNPGISRSLPTCEGKKFQLHWAVVGHVALSGLKAPAGICTGRTPMAVACGLQNPERAPRFRDVSRVPPVSHSLDLLGVCKDSLVENDMIQLTNLQLKKSTFRFQAFFLQPTVLFPDAGDVAQTEE